tara:strand:- start:1756 stop:2325 length:570 start_codon:yes stop_codon:yes gene_type:complete
MKHIYLIFIILMITGCSKPRTVLICGDHICINKAEAEQYFEENLSLEVKVIHKKKKNNIDLIELNLEEYPSGGKKITLLNKDNTTERLKDLTKKEKNEIKKTINMKKKEKKKLTKQNIAKVEENIDQKKSKSKKTKKLLKEIDNKKVNRNSMQVVDVCTILEKCNIEEISKYLLEQGRKKNFPDITIRQ